MDSNIGTRLQALSAATLTWWFVATLGIAAIVAIVGYLFFWKTDLERAAEKTERLKNETENIRNRWTVLRIVTKKFWTI